MATGLDTITMDQPGELEVDLEASAEAAVVSEVVAPLQVHEPHQASEARDDDNVVYICDTNLSFTHLLIPPKQFIYVISGFVDTVFPTDTSL